MKILKNIVLIIMGILLIATIAMQFMGAWMPVVSIGTGLLFLYYLLVYLLILYVRKTSNRIIKYIVYFLVFAPLLWIIVGGEALLDGFMHQALKDYHYQI